MLVAATRLVPAGAKTPLDIDDYAWSTDGKRLLSSPTPESVAAEHARRLLGARRGGRTLRQIGGKAPESSLMFAKFSPDGTRVAYVRANNIYVERPRRPARTTPLTQDGSETTINGTSDWVYEEELGVRDGFRWSPDGARIAYWQFDSTGVGIFSLINDTDSALSDDHADSLSQGRHDEFRRAHRRRRRRGRPDDVDEDRRAIRGTLPRAPRLARCQRRSRSSS